ncbi:zinc-binding dehydrogenase [Mesorhizobium sp.]|uniref:zinc-binding dehydrogenase n=1 Tax=Mesorhizobium sp. TaxID=1871066 RepID=UPI0025F216B2|nr:zinc-binding dehydrogenase [Mesorhizobium sp.]
MIDFAVGDRVAYIGAGPGAYSDIRTVKADKLIRVPNTLKDDAVAANLFKGLTAQYLIKKTFPVRAGHLVLLHAAAGGVGSILASWASKLGATVLGTAGSDKKCAVARDKGCAIAVNYNKPGWQDALLSFTGGTKADVVYDSVGQQTFLSSLDLAAPFGSVVVFGMASGPAPAIDPEMLNRKGCLFLTRPSMFPHNATAQLLTGNSADLFEAMAAGMFDTGGFASVRLADVRDVHRAVEARQQTGSVVLIP